jgi:hypothetical protein
MTRLRLRITGVVLLGLALLPAPASAQGGTGASTRQPHGGTQSLRTGCIHPAPPLTESPTPVPDVPLDPTTIPTETPPPTAEDSGSPPADPAAAPGSGGDPTLPEDSSTSTSLPSRALGTVRSRCPAPSSRRPFPAPASACRSGSSSALKSDRATSVRPLTALPSRSPASRTRRSRQSGWSYSGCSAKSQDHLAPSAGREHIESAQCALAEARG